jgi:hypothetical protein
MNQIPLLAAMVIGALASPKQTGHASATLGTRLAAIVMTTFLTAGAPFVGI